MCERISSEREHYTLAGNVQTLANDTAAHRMPFCPLVVFCDAITSSG